MGKKANVVRDRACMACGTTHNTTSKGLKRQFKLCVAAKRQPPSKDN